MLHIESIRQQIANRGGPGDAKSPVSWCESSISLSISRRKLLMAGAASSAAFTAGASPRIFDVSAGDGTFSITTSNDAKWSVDRDMFDGTPRLNWTKSEDHISLALSHAMLPATGVRCDFTLNARRIRGVWHADFAFPSLRAMGSVLLEEWIDDKEVLLAYANVHKSDVMVAGFQAQFGGPAAMRFDRDWNFTFAGTGIAKLSLNGGETSCSEVTLAIRPGGPSALASGENWRTLASYVDGDTKSLLAAPDDLTLLECPGSCAYQSEFSRTPLGDIQVASLWSSEGAAGLLEMLTQEADPQLLRVPIDSLRVAQLHHAKEPGSALFAGVREGRYWQEVGSASVLLVADGQSMVTAESHGSRVGAACLERTSVESFVVPFIGADSATFRKRVAGAAQCHDQCNDQCECKACIEMKDSFSFRTSAIGLDQFDLSVSRISDGFAGTFRFRGLELRSRRANWYLSAIRGANECLLEFELASQHLQEEAVFSASQPGVSNTDNEVICTPFSTPDSRILALIGEFAAKAWLNPNTPDEHTIQALLKRFMEKARLLLEERQQQQENPALKNADLILVSRVLTSGPGTVLPTGFYKFLTPAYLGLLKGSDEQGFMSLKKLADKKFPEPDVNTMVMHSVDAKPTRLVFEVRFPSGKDEVAFDLACITGWSVAVHDRKTDALLFTERLSTRSLSTDATVEQQQTGEAMNSTPVEGLADEGGKQPATSIQLPYRLEISPVLPAKGEKAPDVRWTANGDYDSAWGGVKSLWHLRLGEPGTAPVPFRALYSPDFNQAHFFQPPLPFPNTVGEFRASLDAHDRHNIVALSSGFGRMALLGSGSVISVDPPTPPNSPPGAKLELGLYVPLPFHAHRLLLTPMGATFDLFAKWYPPGSADGALTVSAWEHHGRIRRDTDCVVEYPGFLMPLGIPAVLIKRTRREFKRRGSSGSYRAVLVQRFTIRVESQPKAYPAHDHSHGSRDWCFPFVAVEPSETPPLLPPGELTDGQIKCSGVSFGRQAFWPMIPVAPQGSCTTGKLFEFTMRSGTTEFKAPLVFVDNNIAHTPSSLKDVLAGYAKEVQDRRIALERAPGEEHTVSKALARVVKGEVEYLPGSSSRNTRHVTPLFVLGVRLPAPQGDAIAHSEDPTPRDLSTADLRFNAEREKKNQPPFYPRISEAILESKLIAGLTGNASSRFTVEFHPTFVAKAFDATDNAGAVFLRFVGQGARMDFGKDTSTSFGAMSPTTEILAISLYHGPVGGSGKITSSSAVWPCARPAVSNALVAKGASLVAPAAPGLRPLAQAAALGGAAGSTDPVAQFMKGISDPMEYFGNVLGDAKLLGCVRLVDIVKTAMQVSGTKVPRIAQEEVFDAVLDVIRPLVLGAGDGTLSALAAFRNKLQDPNAPAAARARLMPSLSGAIEALESARAEVQAASPRGSVVAAQATSAAGHLRRFAEDARALAEDPASLLPPMAQQVIAEAKALLDGLEKLRALVDGIPALFRKALLAELRSRTDEFKRAIERTMQAKLDAGEAAAYAAVAEWIEQLSNALDTMERAVTEAALQAATTALVGIASRVLEFRGWIALAQGAAQSAEYMLVRKFMEGCAQVRQVIVARASDANDAIGEAGDALVLLQAEVQSGSTGPGRALTTQKAAGEPAPELELLRSIVQLREQLSAFQSFLADVALTPKNELDQVKQVLDAVQKLQGLARKTAELIKAQRLAKITSAASRVYVDKIARVITRLGVARALEALASLLASVNVEDARALQGNAVKVVNQAADLLRPLDETNAALENAFLEAKLEVIDEAHRQLAIFLSCALSSPLLLEAAQNWQKALDKAQLMLDATVGKLCGFITAVPVPVITQDGPLSKPLLEKLTALRDSMLALVQVCTEPDAGTPRRSLQSIATMFQGIAALAQQMREIVITIATAVQGGNVGMLLDGRKIVDELIAALGLPTRLRITYEWDTDIEEFPRGGAAVFRPVKGKGSGTGNQPRLGVSSRTEIDLRNGGLPVTTVNGYVDAFDLYLFGAAPFLIVRLDPVRFTSGSGIPLKLDVRVNDVAFGQALKFVDDLAKFLAGDSGLYVKPSFQPAGIEVGYRFNKDIVQLAAVTLQNVSMSVAVVLPFDNSPARFRVAVGSRQKPVLASVGIYGGGFYVAMTMRADTMELLEFAMEYGLVTGVDFGVVTGTAKITAGVYISLGVRDEIGGYFNASGALSVAHLITVGASLVVSLGKREGAMYGDAMYTFEFSLGIIDYSYSVNVAYTKVGKSDMNTSADGKPSGSSGSQSSTAAPMRASANAAEAGSAVRSMETAPAAPTDENELPVNLYSMSIKEEAQEVEPGRRRRPSRGLAGTAVWSAYWTAFSDLDGAESTMCN